MERLNKDFCIVSDLDGGCWIIVPAEHATRFADYIEKNWTPNLLVDGIVFRPSFFVYQWMSNGTVGVVQVHQERTDVDAGFLKALANTITESFYTYCIEMGDDGR